MSAITEKRKVNQICSALDENITALRKMNLSKSSSGELVRQAKLLQQDLSTLSTTYQMSGEMVHAVRRNLKRRVTEKMEYIHESVAQMRKEMGKGKKGALREFSELEITLGLWGEGE